MAIRVLWLKYVSDTCPTWDCPLVPDTYFKDLNEIMLEEWAVKEKLREERDREEERELEEMTLAKIDIDSRRSTTTLKSIEDILNEREAEQVKKWKRDMTKTTKAHDKDSYFYCKRELDILQSNFVWIIGRKSLNQHGVEASHLASLLLNSDKACVDVWSSNAEFHL